MKLTLNQYSWPPIIMEDSSSCIVQVKKKDLPKILPTSSDQIIDYNTVKTAQISAEEGDPYDRYYEVVQISGEEENSTDPSQTFQYKITNVEKHTRNIGDPITALKTDDDSLELLPNTADISTNGTGAVILPAFWQQIGCRITGESSEDQFGNSIALSENGNILAIGTSLNDGNGIDSGHVRVFEFKEYTDDMSGNYHYETRNMNATQTKPIIISSFMQTSQISLIKKVRIEINASEMTELIDTSNRCLNIANVKVYDANNVNVIQSSNTTEQSSTYNSNTTYSSSKVVDNNTNSFNHTDIGQDGWVEITLSSLTDISSIEITQRDGYNYSGTNTIKSRVPTNIKLYSEYNTLIQQINIDRQSWTSNTKSFAPKDFYTFETPVIGAKYWTQLGNDIDGESANDRFGNSVSLSSSGKRVAIGATKNDGNGTDAGHVRVYDLNGSTWTQIGQDINGEATTDQFGQSVSLSEDGNSLVVGGKYGNAEMSGQESTQISQAAQSVSTAQNELTTATQLYTTAVAATATATTAYN